MGFPTVPSVAGWSREETIERVVALLDDPPAKALGSAGVLYRFAREIAVGDLVVTPDGEHADILVGQVTDDYEFQQSPPIDGHPHIRRIDWLGRIAWDKLPLQVRRTVSAPLAVFQPGAQEAVRQAAESLSASRS